MTPGPRRVRGWQRLGLRARLMVVGVLGVAGALALGSAVLYAVLTVAGLRTLDTNAAATAADVAALAEQDRLPDPLPVAGSQLVQVVDARDRVVSASLDADRLTALLGPRELARALAGEHPLVPGSRVGRTGPLRVTAVPVRAATGPLTVVVAQPVTDLRRSRDVLALTLLLTYPLLLAVLAAIAWRVVGAALRPVESLRAAADRISGSGRQERLPVPEAGDEIRALALTLNSMLDRLGAARSRQRDFVADAAHELRSPLTSMRTQLEVSQRLDGPTELTADLSGDVARMTTLVEDLLVLARVDAAQAPAGSVGRVDLDTLVRDVLAGYAGARVGVVVRAARPDGVTGAGGTVVLGPAEELRRALSNLLDNAVRHAEREVAVTVTPSTAAVEVVVADDGAGIPVPDRERVFDRFTRLDEARDRDAGGTGLGLPIARALVGRAGGTLVLEESEGGGLAARITLPGAD